MKAKYELNCELVELEQGTSEWLEWRKSKRTASSTPAVLGCGYHSTAQEALLRYGGGELDVSGVAAVKAGTEQEPIIRERVNERRGANYAPACVENGVWGASLDGLDLTQEAAILEIKYSQRGLECLQSGAILAKYYYQMQHQMATAGLKKALLVVAYGDEMCEAVVEYDASAAAQIQLAWDEFERQYSDFYDFEILKAAEDYAQLKQQICQLEEKLKALEDVLKDTSCSYVVQTSAGRLSLSVAERTSVDYRSMCKRAGLEPSERDKSTRLVKTLRMNFNNDKEQNDE